MYAVVSVEDLNTVWFHERVIQLMDDSSIEAARALASEWGYQLEGEVDP